MSRESPAVILYDENGKRVGIQDNPLNIEPSVEFTTPFNQLRTASPYTLSDEVNKYEVNNNIFGTKLTGSGAVEHVPNHSAIKLSITGDSTDSAILRTHTYYRYQAGKSLMVRQSIYLSDTGQPNQIKRWGFFDSDNGLFWELNGSTFGVVRRTSASGSKIDNKVNQEDWNVDKMDGNGPSGITLDLTKSNIYSIQFAWLGVGHARFYINSILVHVQATENLIAAPYMTTAQLPQKFEIKNTDVSLAGSLTYICSSIFIEGGQEPPTSSFSAISNPETVSTDPVPILSIRLSLLYNNITNRMLIIPTNLSCFTNGGRASIRVIINGVLSEANFISVEEGSGAEYDVSATSITGGTTLLHELLPDSVSSLRINLLDFFSANNRQLRLDAFGQQSDILTIVGVKEEDGNTIMRASLAWREQR